MTDDETRAITVGMRVEDMRQPVEGSNRRTCEQCGHDVWVSPATQRAIRKGEAPETIWCLPCTSDQDTEE